MPLPRDSLYCWRVDNGKSLSEGSAPPLVVRSGESDWSLPAGPSYLVGRDPECDIVVDDARVSWRHAVLRVEDGRWVLADNGSTNGTYAEGQRADRIEIRRECLVRLGHPADGPALGCTVSGAGPGVPGHPPTVVAASRAGGDGTVPPPGQSVAPPGLARPAGQPSGVRPLPARTLRIGRALDNDIVVADHAVSRYHAELRNAAGAYSIADLGSHNGTFVNGQRVTVAPLSDGDIVGIGPSAFRLAGQELQEFAGVGARLPEELPPATAPPAPATAETTAAAATARWRSRTRFAGWCRTESGSRTSTS